MARGSSSWRRDRAERPLVRAETRLGDASPTALLGAFRGLPRGMWERNGRWCAWAGSAAAIAVPPGPEGSRFSRVRRRADAVARRITAVATGPDRSGPADGSGVRFHGGFAFGAPSRRDGTDRERDGGAWAGFPSALFYLPAVELSSRRGGARLAVTVAPGPGTRDPSARGVARRALRRVRRRLAAGAPPAGEAGRDGPGHRGSGPGGGTVRSVESRPGPGLWAEIVEAALGEVRSGELEKVVPARMVELELSDPPDPVRLADRLRAANPDAFPFLIEPAPGRSFAGAAPEIVADLRDGRFHATAVAGTVADSPDPGERERLARQLLASAKDRREHEVGVRDMRRALRSVTGVARVDEEPDVLRLRGVQHLVTNVGAEVSDRTHVLELLEAMHPTAAVNGTPRGPALDFLARHEPFERGWYAGPVGWFDVSGEGEFAPALRSALVRGRQVRMFAGAGIVPGSEPGPEWAETGLKYRPVVEALGLDAEEVTGARPAALAHGLSSRSDL